MFMTTMRLLSGDQLPENFRIEVRFTEGLKLIHEILVKRRLIILHDEDEVSVGIEYGLSCLGLTVHRIHGDSGSVNNEEATLDFF